LFYISHLLTLAAKGQVPQPVSTLPTPALDPRHHLSFNQASICPPDNSSPCSPSSHAPLSLLLKRRLAAARYTISSQLSLHHHCKAINSQQTITAIMATITSLLQLQFSKPKPRARAQAIFFLGKPPIQENQYTTTVPTASPLCSSPTVGFNHCHHHHHIFYSSSPELHQSMPNPIWASTEHHHEPRARALSPFHHLSSAAHP
jgi:hypothetical protein